MYQLKDNHCFPIFGSELKITATRGNGGRASDLLKYITELKWTRRHDNIKVLENLDDLAAKLEKQDRIFILPGDTSVKEAISTYSLTTGYYTEYLHWNNRSVLDGIIDRRGNMIVLNEVRLHVNDRKATCDKLIGIYGQHHAFK